MFITGGELIRVEPGGGRIRHADLSHISPYGWSEITVDGRSDIFVDTINFDWADFDDLLAAGKDRARHEGKVTPAKLPTAGLPKRHRRDAGPHRMDELMRAKTGR